MVTTIDLLDLLKNKYGSDYKAAREMGMTRKRVSQLRNDGGTFTDAQGLKAAELLDFPAETIILSLAAERSLNSPAFGILSNLADQFDPRKTAIIAGIGTLSLVAYFSPFLQTFHVV